VVKDVALSVTEVGCLLLNGLYNVRVTMSYKNACRRCRVMSNPLFFNNKSSS
jgi:hypothetical protein